MHYESLTIFIPSHSLEDLPAELPEEQAEGLLNAFAVAWHPVLLDSAGTLPGWRRADEPPQELRNRLFLVPAAAQDWLPCLWIDHAREQGAVVLTGVHERQAMIDAALGPLGVTEIASPALVDDFLALGHCWLQLEILTRRMRYFSELDQRRLQTEAVSGARAALAGDEPAARSHLKACFEMLLEGRERFYPVDCYLADLCLLTPEMAGEEWCELVRSDRSVNFLVTGRDLRIIAEDHPEEIAALRARWRDGRQEVIGGEWTELASPLLPLESYLPSFERGLATIESLCGRRPTVWGRRKYGVGVQMPQLLDKLGYQGALHFVIDDGLYPDEEQGKHRWEGCDGSVIDAVSRIPLAADSASGMLRFPQRMAESMDYDHAALLVLARWPRLETPWLEDLHRMERYAPVLGRFMTFSDFFRSTDTPGRLAHHKAGDYLSPHLVSAVAREEADPISRYGTHWHRHDLQESSLWSSAMNDLLRGRPIDPGRQAELLATDEPDGESSSADSVLPLPLLPEELRGAAGELARTVVGGRGGTCGMFLANVCSFPRRVVVPCSEAPSAPRPSPSITARQWDDADRRLIVDLPPCGFVWLPLNGDVADESPSTRIPMAEEGIIRNDLFEVRLSDVTGGIAQIRTYRRAPNRLSQQLAFRFPRELTWVVGEGDEASQERTWYSEMRMTGGRIVSDGPLRGEIETTGILVDPTNDAVVARFTQLVRVWRGLPCVEIDVDLEPERMPEGNPWSNYFAIRWAWNDESAALTGSVHEGAHPVTAERFEAPHFVEIADDLERRTTIHVPGLPFHRKTGPRMLDTLLIVAGETRRRFQFVIAIDDPYPVERSRDIRHPVRPLVVGDGPAASTSGWFFHIDSRNVQLARLMPLPTPPASAEEGERGDPRRTAPGVRLRLRETEGRACTATLRCFRSPENARQCDFLGRPLTNLTVRGDSVTVPLTAYEICDVEVHFA